MSSAKFSTKFNPSNFVTSGPYLSLCEKKLNPQLRWKHCTVMSEVFPLCRTFGVKLNLTDESGGQGYGKPSSLRGPPVQGLHENARLYAHGNSTPMFSCMYMYVHYIMQVLPLF